MPPWTIENIERNLAQGKEIKQAILEGASQIAVPALVSTLCICIVFLPMFFLSGVSKFLFVPLAEAVVFAMLASYFLSRTLVPTLAMYLLQATSHAGHAKSLRTFSAAFERGFERLRLSYQRLLATAGSPPESVYSRLSWAPASRRFCWCRGLGQNFFPGSDNGQFILHMRAKSGTRIEETAGLC